MSTLIAVGFKNDRYKAAEALNKLRQMDFDVAHLDDAVAVYRGHNGDLRIDQSYELSTEEGVGWGALWGSLIGLILAIPFTAGATVPAAAVVAGTLGGATVGATIGGVGAKWWKEDFGISNDFVRLVGEMVQPGDSAIFAMVDMFSDEAHKKFEGFGGKVLMTSLTDEQKKKIENVLNHARK